LYDRDVNLWRWNGKGKGNKNVMFVGVMVGGLGMKEGGCEKRLEWLLVGLEVNEWVIWGRVWGR
jgi:hypothetical protein